MSPVLGFGDLDLDLEVMSYGDRGCAASWVGTRGDEASKQASWLARQAGRAGR